MPQVQIHLSGAELRALDAQVHRAPRGALTRSGLVRYLVLQELRRLAQERAAWQRQALAAYLPVVRKVAASWFARCKGAVSLEDLQDVAQLAAVEAAPRLVPGYSPAPFLRQAAHYACLHLVQERVQEAQEVRPDQDPGRWERLGGTEEQGELGLRGHLEAFARSLGKREGAILAGLVQGLGEDEVAAQARCTVAEVEALRSSLAAYLEGQGVEVRSDEDWSPARAAQEVRVPAKVVYKAIRSGHLPARRREGAWVLRGADVREWARSR